MNARVRKKHALKRALFTTTKGAPTSDQTAVPVQVVARLNAVSAAGANIGVNDQGRARLGHAHFDDVFNEHHAGVVGARLQSRLSVDFIFTKTERGTSMSSTRSIAVTDVVRG